MRPWLLALTALACEARQIPATEPVFADVAPILERACGECHGGEAPAAGWRADGYLGVIACPDDAPSAVARPDAPLLAALERDDHAELLDERELALVRAWIEAGAPARIGAAHPGGFVDPRSPDFHGRALREARWAPLFDQNNSSYCARCHSDVHDRDAGAAPGATVCGSCHTEEEGVLDCSTCHGDQGRAFPPRDPCWFPEDRAGAHASHATVECAVCHGPRAVDGLTSDEHGDGTVQVILDGWDRDARTCTGTCHSRGGAGPSVPRWDEELALDCGSCHESPPPDHYMGACSSCHAEVGLDGASLIDGPLHANGVVDLGDGSGDCNACHEAPGGAHPAHLAPSIAAPITCDECHEVPGEPLAAGHFDDALGAEVRFGALASARGAMPEYDGESCGGVACHGDGLGGGTFVAPRWAPDDRAGACGACHSAPPPPPHAQSSDCGASICHGGAIAPGPSFTDLGRALHVDGVVQP